MADQQVSAIFDPTRWREVPGFDFDDITYHRGVEHGTVRIAFNRPEVRNAFRPRTVDQLYTALDHARMSTDVGCVLLTGNGPSPKDGGWAFCSGGDQRIRGKDGYKYTVTDASGAAGTTSDTIEAGRAGRPVLQLPRSTSPQASEGQRSSAATAASSPAHSPYLARATGLSGNSHIPPEGTQCLHQAPLPPDAVPRQPLWSLPCAVRLFPAGSCR